MDMCRTMEFAYMKHAHSTHPEAIKRLRRAEGQLRGTIEMIEQGRPCLDVAQQLQAVEKAIQQAKRTLIQDHLDHCLEGVIGPMARAERDVMDQFKEITRYL